MTLPRVPLRGGVMMTWVAAGLSPMASQLNLMVLPGYQSMLKQKGRRQILKQRACTPQSNRMAARNVLLSIISIDSINIYLNTYLQNIQKHHSPFAQAIFPQGNDCNPIMETPQICQKGYFCITLKRVCLRDSLRIIEQSRFGINSGKLSMNYMDLFLILLITTLIMKQLLFLLMLLLAVSAQIPIPLPPCLQYLSHLQSLYNSSRAEFMKEMAPYAVWSGKILDDMGFPISCLKNPSNAFWEVEVGVTSDDWGALTMYYGLCFTAVCNAENLNQNAGFLINALIQNTTEADYEITTVQFAGVQMEPEITAGSIVVSILLSLFALSRMASSFLRWGKLCASNSEEEAIAVESQDMQQDKQAGRMPEHSLSFLQRYSLGRAFSIAFQKEQSKKIYAFSLFKILAMPFIAFGYLFYLSNYGALNYFSFQEEIYGKFYAKVAGFAYYLPDAFFFISAFILARKLILKDQSQGSSALSIFGAVGKRLLKLYPLYIVIILVYGFVTPSLHSGPLWNVYMQQVDQCSEGWWRALLLIDNWWNPGCFSFAWYVQAEMQLALIVALLFLLYSYRRDAAMITLYILLIASFVGLFFGAKLPTSIQTATSHDAILYFQSFYSYLFFYLLGVYFAFVFDKLSVRTFIRDRVLTSQPLITGMSVFAFALILLVVLRPGLWEDALKMELALSRIGVMLSLIIFFLPSLAQEEAYASRVHRLSRLTYGIILAIGLVTAGGFWGLNFFAYVDAINLLQSSLSYLLVAVAVGGPLAVIFDLTPFILPDTA